MKHDDTSIIPTLDTLREVASLVEHDGPAPARYGILGACTACKKSGASHHDTAGKFIGCPAVPEGTVFVLVPVPGAPRAGVLRRVGHTGVAEAAQAALPKPAAPIKPPVKAKAAKAPKGPRKPRKAREFTIARYFATLPKGVKALADVDLGDSEHRRKVLKAIMGADNGMLVRDIITKAKLSNGAVQQALSWLRAHEVVGAREDSSASES